MFGLRHSGYQGQRVTSAVTWIHQRLGLNTDEEKLYNSINYSDDIGGCEETRERAESSSNALSNLLVDLGLKESLDKYHPPSTSMPYLGVQFDTCKMEMSVPPDKLSEVREDLEKWKRKTTTTKKELQQLLGSLFWISRCVRFSRPLMGRLLQQLRFTHNLPDNKKVPLTQDSICDISWWHRYVMRFNGVEPMMNPWTYPWTNCLTLQQELTVAMPSFGVEGHTSRTNTGLVLFQPGYKILTSPSI